MARLHPDESNRKLLDKLEVNLAQAPDSALILAAGLITLHQLPLTNMKESNKRDRIRNILSWSDEPGRMVAQDSQWWLDQDREINLRPDLVWHPSPRHDSRAAGLVVDVKYKAEKYGGFPNPDVYQVLAYCSALQLPVGHLVYAKGNEPVRECVLPQDPTRSA